MLTPPFIHPSQIDARLRERGFAVLDAAGLSQLVDAVPGRLDDWRAYWNDLPPDPHLRDGGRYRRRRHACFVVEGGQVTRAPHRAHWQPVEYNALHGGIERWFEPMDPAWVSQPLWQRLIAQLAEHASALRGQDVAPKTPAASAPQGGASGLGRPGAGPWYVEAHPFRIDTTGGIGRPTPEGAHRDGVDLVVVILVSREGVKGGETRVFEATGPHGIRFTMNEAWTTLLLDDQRVIHETTPIQPAGDAPGHRDTLVLTFRAGGFQGPQVVS
jgi:hypothetical protein